MHMPINIAIKYVQNLLSLVNFSITNPITKAAGIYPIIYPPVGPNNVPNPPRNIENTGTPNAPRIAHTIRLMEPSFDPKSAPAQNTANVAKLMGTGPIGIAI